MYTVLPSPVLQNISGLRFQPLVDFHTGHVVAHEVLVEIPCVNLDVFFASLPARSALQIFFWQATTLLQMPDRGHYWLNLPAEHFLDDRALRLLLSLRHQQRITIEIQDPLTITRMSEAERQRLRNSLIQLRAAGWKIWLDDLTRDLTEDFLRLALALDGVKIDRSELNARGSLRAYIESVKTGIADRIVIEGIENSQDLERARATGARFGQGFLWPESRIDARVPL
ncbi:EAL domain-containing protein [Enterobacter wuhouensis]|jgi:EAL domain-containing protein (putative c-di-GMP-specific phosphodiesterase class I)|uniref:EAL domain-containing protein n=1 Tax=Enterobacter wuhouensis TaxID=2529381 RepID=A0ABZ1DHU7_9ENTR|nr:EAL domain-containing protein [Enterobacter wuhouensis]WRW31621.1 EAL domain-containing protein [Enterobacter wuhouensis]